MYIEALMSHLISAKYCPAPPDPPEGGIVLVHSDGYMYGHNCSTNGTFVKLLGAENCSNPIIKYDKSTEYEGIRVSTYKIQVSQSTPGQSIVALLTFTQPVDSTQVKVSGDVSYSVHHLYTVKPRVVSLDRIL
jgi:hypothetical protein